MSKEQLEQAIWHGEPPSSGALKVHMFRLRDKIDKPFDIPLLKTVPGYGFTMRADNEN